MKTKVYIFPLILFIPFWLYSQSVWNYVTPLPQENSILEIKLIPGTNKIIAVGHNSTVMVSQDGGDTWNVTHNPGYISNYINCRSVHFINDQVGFIGTDYEKILKTTDAGVTWDVVYSIDSCSWQNKINDFTFINDTVGFAVGNYRLLLKTTDGGQYWVPILTSAQFDLYAIEFINENTGMIVGESWAWDQIMIKTIDGGNNWQTEQINFQTPTYGNAYFDLYFFDENTGIMSGLDNGTMNSYGYIYKTDNGGESWYEVFETITSIHPRKIDFFDQTNGIATGFSWYFDTGILKTEDGGDTWLEVVFPTDNTWWEGDVCFLNENDAILVGNTGSLYKTYDAGETWDDLLNRYFYFGISNAQFINETTGFVLTRYGNIKGLFKTNDGGSTWTMLIQKNYSSFYFNNASVGYFAYNNSGDFELLKSLDGGETWQVHYTDTLNLKPIKMIFINESEALIASRSVLLKTSNGGEMWIDITPPQIDYISGISFKSSLEIFVVGQNSDEEFILLYSTDGGFLWQSVGLQNDGFGWDIKFINENTGFIACSNSTIYKTTDGGINWYETMVNNNNSIVFHGIDFPSEYVGYAVGDGSHETIVKTIDGGETWDIISSGTSSGLDHVQFFDNETGLVFGNQGVILKTTNGGATGFENITKSEAQSSMFVYPNPFNDYSNIRFSLPENAKNATINIYSLNGGLINSFRVNVNKNQIKITGNSLKAGAYYVELKIDNGKSVVTKIIKLNQS